jgi:hypothetical protein
VSCKASDSNWLSGENIYRLRVLANTPAKQRWSATTYSEATRQMVVTAQDRSGTFVQYFFKCLSRSSFEICKNSELVCDNEICGLREI